MLKGVSCHCKKKLQPKGDRRFSCPESFFQVQMHMKLPDCKGKIYYINRATA
jgi:hypothetical protein